MADVEATTPKVEPEGEDAEEPESSSSSTDPSEPVLGPDGQPMSKAALKKLKKLEELAKRKAIKAEAKAGQPDQEAAKLAARAAVLEAAKQVVLVEDPALPPARKVSVEEALTLGDSGERVTVSGWVHHYEDKGKVGFILVRDGSGFPNVLPCVISGDCKKTYDAFVLSREATVEMTGRIETAKGGKERKVSVEMQVDFWRVVAHSASSIENEYNKEAGEDVLMDKRHLVLRQTQNIYIMRLRSHILQAFREHFWAKKFFEITPPTIVQTQVEGGSTLFKFDYFGAAAYLTQSSQLYLETVVPVLGRSFCCMPSYRAEKHRTRRHLSEYTHFEAEMGFITFNDLLDTIEDMVVNVAERLFDAHKDLLLAVNPQFKVPKKPFRRMDYSDAIQWLREHKVYKDEESKTEYEFGDDIPEAPERFMTDTIGEPILLCRFPTTMKPFYMYRDPQNPNLTESVDLLMPGVGEIVGGSMRSWDLDQLMAGFKHEKIDPEPYYWYTDLRRYGSCPHGGFGLGIERYICWILGLDHIRHACLYPRVTSRARP